MNLIALTDMADRYTILHDVVYYEGRTLHRARVKELPHIELLAETEHAAEQHIRIRIEAWLEEAASAGVIIPTPGSSTSITMLLH